MYLCNVRQGQELAHTKPWDSQSLTLIFILMRLKITLDTIEEFNEVRELLDKASVASYPAYSMDEKSLQWHNPTLVAVGTPNAISHVEHYVLKGRNVKMEEEKGY